MLELGRTRTRGRVRRGEGNRKARESDRSFWVRQEDENAVLRARLLPLEETRFRLSLGIRAGIATETEWRIQRKGAGRGFLGRSDTRSLVPDG